MADYDIDETIALDLGTSNSCCYFYKDGSLTLLQVEGKGTVPSVVRITEKATIVGEVAKKSLGKPDTLFELKRILARKYDDPVVTECVKNWPFNIEANEKGIPVAVIKLGEKESYVKPIDFYMYIIRYFIDEVKKQTGREVKNIVMTVPAYFGEHQRKATMFAAQTLNLRVLYLMNEPTAAAIAYACENDLRGKTILVYDLGGGTFDVSILEVKDKFEVLATSGDSHLGGIDFTNRLYEIIEKKVKQQLKSPLSKSQEQTLLRDAERIKIAFSYEECDCVEEEVLDEEPRIVLKISRDEFNANIDDLIRKSEFIVENCLQRAGMVTSDIDDVILIGGSSQILAVRRSVQQFFGGKKPMANINPAEAVARGAMCFACEKKGINIVQTMIPLEETNTTPVVAFDNAQAIRTPFGGDPRNTLVPGTMSPITQVRDVCPMRYVVKLPDDKVHVVVEKDTKLPCEIKYCYETATDYQTNIHIHIAQGNSDVYSENDEYGELVFNSIPSKPKGEVKVELHASVNEFCQVSFRAYYNNVPASFTFHNDRDMKRKDGEATRVHLEEIRMTQIRNRCAQSLQDLLKHLPEFVSGPNLRVYYDNAIYRMNHNQLTTFDDYNNIVLYIDGLFKQYNISISSV